MAKLKAVAAEASTEAKPAAPEMALTIRPPKIAVMSLTIQGDPSAPYVQHRFSAKARAKIQADQELGDVAKKNKRREPKDFDAVYRDACHISTEGWYGIPAASIRAALISACRVSGFQMTAAKLSLFIEADGRDADDGSPLVKIKGDPTPLDSHVRNATGTVDLRRRPAWYEWEADVRIVHDADVFKADDILHLILRAGTQCGIGEGRHDSKKSYGQGWGVFSVKPGSVSVIERSLTNDIHKLYAKSREAA